MPPGCAAIGLFCRHCGLFVVWWLLLRLRTLLILLVVSLFLAIAIEPAVNALARRGWRRGAATAVVFLVLLVAAAGFVVAIGSLLVDQVSNLTDAVPGYVEETIALINRTFDANLSSDTLVAQLSSAESPVRRFATGLAGSALGIGVQLLTLLFQLLTVALFTFYFAADGPRFRRAVFSVLPRTRECGGLDSPWSTASMSTRGPAGAVATATWAFCGSRCAEPLRWHWVVCVPSSRPPDLLAGALPALARCCRDPRCRLVGLHRRYRSSRTPVVPAVTARRFAAPGGGSGGIASACGGSARCSRCVRATLLVRGTYNRSEVSEGRSGLRLRHLARPALGEPGSATGRILAVLTQHPGSLLVS